MQKKITNSTLIDANEFWIQWRDWMLFTNSQRTSKGADILTMRRMNILEAVDELNQNTRKDLWVSQLSERELMMMRKMSNLNPLLFCLNRLENWCQEFHYQTWNFLGLILNEASLNGWSLQISLCALPKSDLQLKWDLEAELKMIYQLNIFKLWRQTISWEVRLGLPIMLRKNTVKCCNFTALHSWIMISLVNQLPETRWEVSQSSQSDQGLREKKDDLEETSWVRELTSLQEQSLLQTQI